MNEYKSLNKYLTKNEKKSTNKYFTYFLSKSFLAVILFLSFLISIKYNPSFKSVIYKEVYENNLSFSTFRSFYDKHFGDILPSSRLFNSDVMVFNEKLTYKEASLYKDGVALVVDYKYLVPLIKDGVVVFIGKKDEYGDVVIVDSDDIEIWYCNINTSDISIYDYLKKGSFIGEAKEDVIYLVFKKDKEFLDYKDYI